MALPNYTLTLQEAKTNDDAAAMAIVHNLNMQELAEYVNSIKTYLTDGGSTGGGGDTTSFPVLLEQAKKQVTLLAGMTDGQTIEFDQFQLKRIGIVAGTTRAVEFRITDLDATRNTNFRKSFIRVTTLAGDLVYPIINQQPTWLSIQFNDQLEVAQTQVDQPTDPNNKRITIL